MLCLALCAVVIDNTILNVALPTLRRALHANETDLQWITTAYALTLSGLLLPFGVLGDRFGRRGVLLAGLVVFASASVAASFTTTPLQLSLARGAMGVGGAAVTPSTLSLLGNIFSAEERVRAIAIWSGVAGLAAAAGPVAGGLLLSRFWWGSVFLVNVPVVTLTVVGAVVLLPRSRAPVPRPIDGRGSLLWAGSLALLLFAVIEGPVRGWRSFPVLAAGAVACGLLVLFARQERRARAPMLPPPVARDRRMRAGATSVVGMFFALFGTQFTLTQWIQGSLGRSALVAGLCFTPMALATVVTTNRGPRLARRIGPRAVVTAGLAVMGSGLALAAIAETVSGHGRTASLIPVAAALVVVGSGQGLAIPSGVELMMTSVPAAQAGSAAGVNETLVEAGGAVGVAVLGSALAAGSGFALPIFLAAGAAGVAAATVHRTLRPRR
ncbi:MAG TPA: MFS transporter [Acidimicrobiales bacterium]|nr:MFS transporter [Acidimicrobiales bacterium]